MVRLAISAAPAVRETRLCESRRDTAPADAWIGFNDYAIKQFHSIVARIERHLAIDPTDVVLDLCCGNGVITEQLARRARIVVGVDLSPDLIEFAEQAHCPDNTTYCVGNVLEVDWVPLVGTEPFTKVLMYGALQHFKRRHLTTILANIQPLMAADSVVLIGFVPDRRRRWAFCDSPRRVFVYLLRRISGTDLMGTWWQPLDLERRWSAFGLTVELYDLPPDLHAAKYRFDARIT